MLKYILLLGSFIISVHCHPLVTEQTPVDTVPIHQADEEFSSVVPSLISEGSHKISAATSQISTDTVKHVDQVMRRAIPMSPVENIRDIQDDLSPKNTGGQKRVRQIQEESPSPTSGGSPPPTEELCSIFQFFLESRRYSRCRVSNSNAEGERSSEPLPGPPPPPRGPLDIGHRFDFNPNFHRPVSNEVAPSSDTSGSDNFQSGSENREIENVPQRNIVSHISRQMELGGSARMEAREQTASKRYDNLDELQIHSGPLGPSEDHLIVPPPGPPPMFPKSSLDRTTIIVPERPCPRGERRDHKGFCRRIVRVRPNYQYGPPPPPPYGPPRPRYYYTRFVSVPTLQFFIPAVP